MSLNWFVAWPVLGADEWLRELEAAAPAGLRFFAAEDIHVTLAFLGRHDAKLEKKISSLLRGLPLKAARATLSRLVALPQERRFSALAFEIQNGRIDLEKQMAKWRDRICREAGARIDAHPSLPHLTVARPERKITDDNREAVLEWAATLPAPAVEITLSEPRVFLQSPDRSDRKFHILD